MKRTIVTSALPYINGVKHLGNLIGSLLPADIYARFLRQKGEDVIFISGTDDHGAPAEIAAESEGLAVEDFCSKMYVIQKEIYDQFGLSFDHFGRSSNSENHVLTQDIFKKLYEQGYIVEETIVQLYDEQDKRFLPDRYIQGTCPHCGFEQARGDQCDNCARLLDAVELIAPRSAVTGSTALVRRESHQLALRLSAFEARLAEWIDTKEHYWPANTVSIARKWLKEGLRDRGITRDLKWGIQVPLSGYENSVFYVWFDAPNAYMAITQEWAKMRGEPDLWKAYWKDPETRIVQFMAKDNIPFHTIIWPAMLMGVNDGYELADFIKGFEYLNYEGGKFSTSLKRGVFTDAAIAEFPADYWRYYLVTIIPERSDSDFTWTGFQQAVNNLADVLGNFIHRTLSFLNRYFEGKVPTPPLLRPSDQELWGFIEERIRTCEKALYSCNFGEWVRTLREIWVEGNRYFDSQAPWATRKQDPKEAETTLYNAARLCRAVAILSSPLIPFTCEKIFRQLNLDGNPAALPWEQAMTPEPFSLNHCIAQSIRPICEKIEDKRIPELKNRFDGEAKDV